jgi:hypothetical protein
MYVCKALVQLNACDPVIQCVIPQGALASEAAIAVIAFSMVNVTMIWHYFALVNIGAGNTGIAAFPSIVASAGEASPNIGADSIVGVAVVKVFLALVNVDIAVDTLILSSPAINAVASKAPNGIVAHRSGCIAVVLTCDALVEVLALGWHWQSTDVRKCISTVIFMPCTSTSSR